MGLSGELTGSMRSHFCAIHSTWWADKRADVKAYFHLRSRFVAFTAQRHHTLPTVHAVLLMSTVAVISDPLKAKFHYAS